MSHRQLSTQLYRACVLVGLAGTAAVAASSYDALADGQQNNITSNAGVAGVLRLRTGPVITGELRNELHLAAFSSRYILLEVHSSMTADRRTQLLNAGATIIAYYPKNYYLVDATGALPAAMPGFVSAAYAYQQSWKLHSDISNAAANVRANIWLFSGQHNNAADFANLGITVVETEKVGKTWRIAADGDSAAFTKVAAIEGVQFIEPLLPYEPRNNVVTRWTIQTGVSNVTPLYAAGITGLGQVIGVIDGGLAVNHCSFIDAVNPIGPLHRKILAYNRSVVYDSHGTHVACTALGEWEQGGTNFLQRGVAYNAKIVFNTHPDQNESSMYSRHFLHYSQGAFVHTNSWGTDLTNQYDGGCRGMDVFLRENEDVIVTHAASNGSFVRNPENAKNSLCVTAGGNGATADSFCAVGGSGPTLDGRRKPEVVAPGCSISSATGTSGCNTTTYSGTSMATPAIAGLAALTREYYLKGFYPSGAQSEQDGFVPSGPLVKATIVNSAQDMLASAGYPSNREGWGRVIADRTLYFAGDTRKLIINDVRSSDADALDTGGSSSMNITVTSSSEPLRVTMTYYDLPAEVNAELTPVNNLDLIVTAPDGSVYRGNWYVGGVSAAGGDADTLNNLEQVYIISPQTGEWSIRVVAAAVAMDTQGFALVASGAIENVVNCFADFNQDGGVDGTDIEAFFVAWSQSNPEADVNNDGGVDGADVEVFFDAWQDGGC